MKIKIKNLGPVRQAEFELGELTIICGKNNTGKTYATYALFGFLLNWRGVLSIKVPESKIHQLLTEGATEINTQDYVNEAQQILKQSCKDYTKMLPEVFFSSEKLFASSEFLIEVDEKEIHPKPDYEIRFGPTTEQLFSITKKAESPIVTISLLVKNENIAIPPEEIERTIEDALKEIIFEPTFPKPFIASAERTGVSVFDDELTIPRYFLRDMGKISDRKSKFGLSSIISLGHSLPVEFNMDFTRRLEEITKQESFIAIKHPGLLNDVVDLIGGEYRITGRHELYFVPKGKDLKLTINESSSAVRALLILGFYLRHVAQKGDILIIDEPELNLHPENQRRIARLFAALVNIGIKIFITTHSDYIIKELNTLIMLNSEKPRLKAISKREGYNKEEILSPEKVRVYIAEEALILLNGHSKRTRCQTLTPADIDPELGIEVPSFDQTIDEMNRIQEEIVWGD